MQIKTDHFFLGMGVGLVMPVLAFLLSTYTDWSSYLGDKPLVIYALAALANLFVVRYFYNKGMQNNARGVVLVTFVCAMILVFSKQIHLG